MNPHNNQAKVAAAVAAGFLALSGITAAAMLHFGVHGGQSRALAQSQSGSGTDEPEAPERERLHSSALKPDAIDSSDPPSLGDADALRGTPGDMPDGIGEADGKLPAGVTVFDSYPAITNLEPDLRAALHAAATAAKQEGIVFYVSSGWRSRAFQEYLLEQQIAASGSEAEAAKWAAPADKSLHVLGRAIDLGNVEAEVWLSSHGAAFGLCQTYENEPWHYELRPEAKSHGCPLMYADASYDPRLQ